MTHKQPYKQTEVGMIPEDWEMVNLGSVSNITKLAGFEYSKHFNSYKDGGDIIVLRGTNITYSKLDLADVKKIPSQTSNLLLRSKLFKGDLVFAYVGTIGPIYLVEEDDRFHLGPNTSKIRVNKEIDAQYIFSYFNSWLIKNEIFLHTSIGAQPSLSMSKIRKFRIALPPTLAEQQAIATALSDMDALIGAQEQLIAKKRAIKQGAMQELLRPKEGWRNELLGNLALIQRGGSPRPIENYLTESPNGINWIKIGDVSSGAKYITSTKEKIISEGIQSSRRVKEGDFLLSNSMSFGRPYILKTSGCIHDGWLAIQDYENTFDTDFLYYSLGFETTLNQYKSLAAGSTVLNLNKEIVKNVTVYFPEKKIQSKIASTLSDMDEEIARLESALQKYRQLKQGMMQELLTGKTRLHQHVSD